MRKRLTALGLVVMMTLAGCASATMSPAARLHALADTGDGLVELGQQFLQTAQRYDALYRQGRVPEAHYAAWRRYTPEFQAAYAAAVAAYQTAVAAPGNADAATQAATALQGLRAALTAYYLTTLREEAPR